MVVRATRRPRWLTAVMGALTVTILCAGCAGPPISGSPRPTGLDPGTVAGLPVTNGPSGLRPGVSNAHLTVQNTNRSAIDTFAENALADIFDFWSQTMPQDFGKKFTPPKKFVSYDSNTDGFTDCGQNVKGDYNAFYCPSDNSLSWDRGGLLPDLQQSFGDMAIALVLAHETGHAVQYQLGAITHTTDTIIAEQQADCYAGTFMRWVAEGNAKHLQLSTGDGLDKAMGAMLYFRDQPGNSSTDPSAHGTAFDRITAFQYGFADGAQRCSKIDAAEIHQRITELGFVNQAEKQNNDNLPVDDETLALLKISLDDAFKLRSFSPPQIENSGGQCTDGSTNTSPVSYCAKDDTISIDETKLQQIATPPQNGKLGTSGTGLGDFAAFAEIASRYVLAVEKSQKLSLTNANAGLRTACLVGAWGGVARTRTGDPNNKLLLGSDDLDKAVAELLSSNSVIAADANGTVVPSGFARVEAFQIGFLQGSKACTTRFS